MQPGIYDSLLLKPNNRNVKIKIHNYIKDNTHGFVKENSPSPVTINQSPLCLSVITLEGIYLYMISLKYIISWYILFLDTILMAKCKTVISRCVRNEKTTIIMTSWNGNIFRVTGHLCREFTGHWWIPHTNASDVELWCFLWSEWMVE